MNNINPIDKCENQCSFFRDERSHLHVYEFDDKNGIFKQKTRIAFILAKIIGFFSKAYKERQQDTLKNKLITFYKNLEKSLPSSQTENQLNQSIKKDQKSSKNGLFMRTLKGVINFCDKREKKTTQASSQEVTKERTITDVLTDYFPELSTSTSDYTTQITAFFQQLNYGSLPQKELIEIFKNNEKFNKKVLMPIVVQVIITHYENAKALIALEGKTLQEIENQLPKLLRLGTVFFLTKSKNNEYKKHLSNLKIEEKDLTKKIRDFIAFLNENLPQNLDKITLQQNVIEDKIEELKRQRDAILRLK
jgi:hypothetical protein